MKLIITALFAFSLAAQEPKTPPPAPPADVTITITVDGVESKVNLSNEMADTFTQFMHAQQFTGAFGERMIAWLFKGERSVGAALMAKPEFVPVALKPDLDAENAARIARAAKLVAATAEKKK